MKQWWGVSLLGAAILAGCSSSGGSGEVGTIQLTANAMAFDSKEISVQKGEMIKVVLENQDVVEHDFTIEEIPGKAGKQQGAGHGKAHVDLHVHADPKRTESVEFTPSTEGTYDFYCAVPGHKEAGMAGQLIVQ